MTILIVGSNGRREKEIDLVTTALKARGATVGHFASDDFPATQRLVAGVGLDRAATDCIGDHLVEDITAIWNRYTDVAANLPESLSPDDREVCAVTAQVALDACLESLPVFQMDPRWVTAPVFDKLGQTRMAASLGLRVPKTLLSNDPTSVMALAEQCPGGIVAKMSTGDVQVASDDGWVPMYTTDIDTSKTDALAGLELSPLLFQERIAKASELRITAVGTEFFAAELPFAPDVDPTDWRRDLSRSRDLRHFGELPSDLVSALSRMLDRFGLNFATFDVIVTPKGEFVFVEMNPLSYFAFVEQATGLAISDAVADVLLDRRPRRANAALSRLTP